MMQGVSTFTGVRFAPSLNLIYFYLFFPPETFIALVKRSNWTSCDVMYLKKKKKNLRGEYLFILRSQVESH